MSANAITTPYQHFVGLDGLPLEDGYIYIGTANTNAETSPISIYWDSDLTIPAYQPIRTTSGYISKNGSPGALFVNGDYSITVRDKNGVLIYTALESNSIINITYAIVNSTLKASPDVDDIIPIVDNIGNLKHITAESIFTLIHGSSLKTPVDADELLLLDSATTYATKRFTWATLKSTLKTYLDTLYVALLGDQTIAGIKTFASSPVVPDATTSAQALAYGQVAVANSAPVKTAVNAAGSAPIYACRAWGNMSGIGGPIQTGTYTQSGTTVTVTLTAHGYSAGQSIIVDCTSGTGVDGTYTIATAGLDSFTYTAGTSLTTSGNISVRDTTPAFRASGNFSSISDGGTGLYTLYFTTAMADANYCVHITAGSAQSGENTLGSVKVYNASYVTILTAKSDGTEMDLDYINVAIFK